MYTQERHTLLHNVSEKKDTNYIHGKYRNAMPSKNNDTCNVTNQCTGKQFFILEMPYIQAPFMSRRLLGTSKKLLFWWNQLQVDSHHTGSRQISINIIRFIYHYIKEPHRSKKRLCNCIYLKWNTFHISSTSILSANLPSLLDNKDTSPFKHESVTSFMLEAHLKCDDYKYYRSRTQNKTPFKYLGHPRQR